MSSQHDHQSYTSAQSVLVSRRTAEIATALVTAGLGGAVATGAFEFGIAWTRSGPQAGTFPFYVGLIIVVASIGNLAVALFGRSSIKPAPPFLTREQGIRVATFAGPILVFVLGALILGLYVAGALYLAITMIFQGRYPIWKSALAGLGISIFFYVVLERWFNVSLLKGPLEAMLGLH